jgi:hypothetical protein
MCVGVFSLVVTVLLLSQWAVIVTYVIVCNVSLLLSCFLPQTILRRKLFKRYCTYFAIHIDASLRSSKNPLGVTDWDLAFALLNTKSLCVLCLFYGYFVFCCCFVLFYVMRKVSYQSCPWCVQWHWLGACVNAGYHTTFIHKNTSGLEPYEAVESSSLNKQESDANCVRTWWFHW